MAIDRFPLNALDGGGAADGDRLVWNATLGMWVPQASAGGSLTVQDENGTVATGVTQLDFQGAGVTAAAGTGEVVVTIPGGGGGSSSSWPPGSADKPPASPNAKDDEFDGTSTVTWTSTPTAPNAWDINTTRAHHAYLKAISAAYVGKYQAVPASAPYTITTRVASATARANYQRGGGIILAPAAPTSSSNILYAGLTYNDVSNGGRSAQRVVAQFGGTFVSQSNPFFKGYWGTVYIKVRVNSATSVDSWASTDGFNWVAIETGFNPGFTPAFMGLAVNDENALIGSESYFDFFRVT